MTEQEWLDCTNPQKMLEFFSLRCKGNHRKTHLFACACVRRIWGLLKDERIRHAVEWGEQLADGLIAASHIDDAWTRWVNDDISFFSGDEAEVAALAATGVSAQWWFDDAQHCSVLAATGVGPHDFDKAHPAAASELKSQEQLLRCIAGNPFRSIFPAASFVTDTILSLAKAAYEERILPAGQLDPDRLAILADALEDAGCTDAAILDHLRGPSPHVRGCWAVDLLLGKS